MATFSKVILSGGVDGQNILVAATSSPGTTIHTADSTAKDEIWIDACNNHTADLELVIQYGGTSSPADDIAITLPARSGKILVIPGDLLTNSKVVKAYCATANKIVINGWVNRIS